MIDNAALRALGLSRSDVEYRVRTKRLFRKHPNVFAVGRPDLTLDGVFLGAVLACGDQAKLCRRSALRKWGLRRDDGLIVEIDSARYHGTRWRRHRDAAETAALRAQGWTVLRFWDVEINGTPAQVATTVLAAMRGPERRN